MTTYYDNYNSTNPEKISEMVGAIIVNISGKVGDEELIFSSSDGRRFVFWYEHDCCAGANITDIIGDLPDLLYVPLLMAEEVSSENEPKPYEDVESYTWTFYKFATIKGYVTIRWLGESNGYYSEGVSFRIDNG